MMTATSGMRYVREISDAEFPLVLEVLALHPEANCMVSARLEGAAAGRRTPRPTLLTLGDPSQSLCYVGAAIQPLLGNEAELQEMARAVVAMPRIAASVMGARELVLPLWSHLQPVWGGAREVRGEQPLLALTGPPAVGVGPRPAGGPPARLAERADLGRYTHASALMFAEEMGVDPRRGGHLNSFIQRCAGTIKEGHAWVVTEGDTVVFKAEIGTQSRAVAQIQGVWVNPNYRGQGWGSYGMRVIAESIVASGRSASLYVNAGNAAARRMYTKVGFQQVGEFATVLID